MNGGLLFILMKSLILIHIIFAITEKKINVGLKKYD